MNMHSDNTRWMISLLVGMVMGLSACGGDGPGTTENPFSGDDGDLNTGPPAADEDTRAFELSLWNNLKASNRCGQCHGSSS